MCAVRSPEKTQTAPEETPLLGGTCVCSGSRGEPFWRICEVRCIVHRIGAICAGAAAVTTRTELGWVCCPFIIPHGNVVSWQRQRAAPAGSHDLICSESAQARSLHFKLTDQGIYHCSISIMQLLRSNRRNQSLVATCTVIWQGRSSHAAIARPALTAGNEYWIRRVQTRRW